MESVSNQAEMLHLHGSRTEQDSMEVVVSHKKHCHMNFHLCKENHYYITVTQNVSAYVGNSYKE